MSQPKITISESVDDLRSLMRRYRDTPGEPRLKLLLALREEPAHTIASLAAAVNVSEPTAKRWLALYRKFGLQALLVMRGGSSRSEVDARIVELQRLLNSRELQTVEEVQQWLEQGGGVAERKGEQYLVDTNEDSAPLLPSNIMMLLNDLPTVMSHVEWVRYFQRILLKLVPDVDRVIIAVNTECDLLDSQNYRPDVEAVQIAPSDSRSDKPRTPRVGPPGGTQPYQRILHNMTNDGFPFHEYHPPLPFDYFIEGNAYLGTIILLRHSGKPLIPQQSIDLLQGLERYIVFMLSDCIVRQKYAHPVATAFTIAFAQLSDTHGLSVAERGVFLLQLLGRNYDEIAASLNIAASTVKYHVVNIHRKTGTHSLLELFSRYFTPLITAE
jgi:DNA-binding CsgD family transcriptional regulator